MDSRRTYGSYDDGCAAAHALDLVGARWTMIVVRELLLGPKTFSDLQRDILGIGPTVLTRRLNELVDHGLAEKVTSGVRGTGTMYCLTPWGSRLEKVNTALSEWAVESPALPWEAGMSPDTLILAMRAHARPVPALDEPVAVAVDLIDDRQRSSSRPAHYIARISRVGTSLDRRLATERHAFSGRLFGGTGALKSVILGGRSLADTDGLTVEGDHPAVDHLISATRLIRDH